MNEFKTITTKIAKLLHCNKSKLYILFRVSEQNYKLWKHRNYIPYKNIIETAIKYDLDLNYILKGK